MTPDPNPIYAGCLRLVQTRNAPDNLGFSIELGQWQYNVGFLTVGVTMIGSGLSVAEAYRFKIRLDDGRIFTVFRNEGDFVQWDYERIDDSMDCFYGGGGLATRIVPLRYKGIPDSEAYAEMRLAL